MNEREELAALRRLAYLEAKAKGEPVGLSQGETAVLPSGSVTKGGKLVYDAERDPTNNLSPVDGMSGFAKFGAGLGHRGAITGQGIAQFFGNKNQEAIDERARRDAPLLATGAGKAGDIAGGVVETLPAMAIPGINTYTGAALLGGGMGLLDPVTSGEGGVVEGKLVNAGKGALMGGAGQLAGNLLGAAVRGTKAAIAPLFQSGQEEIANAALQRIAHDPDAAAAAASSYRPSTPGVNPTLAEATLDPGISQLQRSMTGRPAADITAQHHANRRLLIDELRKLGGTDEALEAARTARKETTAPMYDAALNDVRVQNDDALNALMERPSMNEAVGRSMKLGREKGLKLVEGEDIPARTEIIPGQGVPTFAGSQSYGSVSRDVPYVPSQVVEHPDQYKDYLAKGLQYMYMSMDDIVKGTGGQGMGAHEADAVRATQGALNDWLEQKLPAYLQANAKYRELSAPINQMKVGRRLLQEAAPAGSDINDSVISLTPGKLATALRERNETIAKDAAGKWGKRIEDILTTDQWRKVQGIAKDLNLEEQAYKAAGTRGSSTGQNLATQNMIDQISGSLGGGPKMQALARALMRYPMRGFDMLTSPLDEEIKAKVAERLMNPEMGAAALRYAPGSSRTDMLAEAIRRLATPATGFAYSAQE